LPLTILDMKVGISVSTAASVPSTDRARRCRRRSDLENELGFEVC
jgi:hypothetical protein